MKTTLQIMHLKPRWQINWPSYEFFIQINPPKIPKTGKNVKMSSYLKQD